MDTINAYCADDGTLALTVPPIPTATVELVGTIAPGETITVIWHGPMSHDPTVIGEWDRYEYAIPALDCGEATTTSQAAPTTSEVTTSTPASTLPPASVPATTAPPATWAIDTPQTAVTVATTVQARELPATGEPPVAGIIGGTLIVLAPFVWWWGVRGRRPA